MSHTAFLISFAAIFVIELAAFGMQRATLLMSREAGIPQRVGALMLPGWFPAVWLVRVAKWGLLVVLALSWSWLIAVALLVADLVITTVVPIPYRLYVPSFRKRVARIKRLDAEAGRVLEAMLDASAIHGS